jgi:RNA polymerase sigma factor (sigma-70 family)
MEETRRPETDRELIHIAFDGDRQSFDRLANSYRPSILRYCIKVTNNNDAAEDAVQETLLRAWKYRHTYHQAKRLDWWLMGIARNVCRAWLAKYCDAQKIVISPINEEIATIDTHFTSSDQVINRLAILDGLNKLSTLERTILELSVDSLTYKEIGKAVDKTVNNVGVILNRARKKMRATLQPASDEDEDS